MATNPNIFSLLNKVHKKFPKMRVGQLLSNLFPGQDLFYVTNKELKQRLEEALTVRHITQLNCYDEEAEGCDIASWDNGEFYK